MGKMDQRLVRGLPRSHPWLPWSEKIQESKSTLHRFSLHHYWNMLKPPSSVLVYSSMTMWWALYAPPSSKMKQSTSSSPSPPSRRLTCGDSWHNLGRCALGAGRQMAYLRLSICTFLCYKLGYDVCMGMYGKVSMITYVWWYHRLELC